VRVVIEYSAKDARAMVSGVSEYRARERCHALHIALSDYAAVAAIFDIERYLYV